MYGGGVGEETPELVIFSSYEIEEHSYLIDEGKIVAQAIHYTVEQK